MNENRMKLTDNIITMLPYTQKKWSNAPHTTGKLVVCFTMIM